MHIILGSSSASRQQVMRELGLPFTIVTPDIDEKSIRFDDPETLTLAIANAKADAVANKLTESGIVIASDHVEVCEGVIYEKPSSEQEIRELYQHFSNRELVGYSAVVVLNTATGKREQGIERASFMYREIPDAVLTQYIAEGDPWNAAGGIRVQNELLLPYLEYLHGGVDVIMGLPKALTLRLIEEVQN